MEHEAVPASLRKALLDKFNTIITAACHPQPSHIISVALKTGAPNHMIDVQLPNLWRY